MRKLWAGCGARAATAGVALLMPLAAFTPAAFASELPLSAPMLEVVTDRLSAGPGSTAIPNPHGAQPPAPSNAAQPARHCSAVQVLPRVMLSSSRCLQGAKVVAMRPATLGPTVRARVIEPQEPPFDANDLALALLDQPVAMSAPVVPSYALESQLFDAYAAVTVQVADLSSRQQPLPLSRLERVDPARPPIEPERLVLGPPQVLRRWEALRRFHGEFFESGTLDDDVLARLSVLDESDERFGWVRDGVTVLLPHPGGDGLNVESPIEPRDAGAGVFAQSADGKTWLVGLAGARYAQTRLSHYWPWIYKVLLRTGQRDEALWLARTLLDRDPAGSTAAFQALPQQSQSPQPQLQPQPQHIAGAPTEPPIAPVVSLQGLMPGDILADSRRTTGPIEFHRLRQLDARGAVPPPPAYRGSDAHWHYLGRALPSRREVVGP